MTLSHIEGLLVRICSGQPAEVGLQEWPQLYRLACIHEVDPLVVWTLREAWRDRANDLTDQLEGIFALNVIAQRLMDAEVIQIHRVFAGVPCLVLKGPALASLYFPPGARLQRDIDLLVADSDYEVARNRLQSIGYRFMDGYSESVQRESARDVGFIRDDASGTQFSVEIHWRLGEPDAVELDPRRVWDRSRHVVIEGANLRTPGPEDTLLLLAFNLRKHRFARLKTLVDIDRLIRHEKVDLEMAHAEAHTLGVCNTLRLALELCRGVLNSPNPEMPFCGRADSVRSRLLRRVVDPEAVMAAGRPEGAYLKVAGLVPFLSLDSWGATAGMARRRLTLTPELASYRAGAPGMYPNRRRYLASVAMQVARAAPDVGRRLRSRPEVATSDAEIVNEMQKPLRTVQSTPNLKP